jgi:hypothetical protein
MIVYIQRLNYVIQHTRSAFIDSANSHNKENT